MSFLNSLFDKKKPAHFSSIAGVTNAVFEQHTEASQLIYAQVMRIFDHFGLKYFLFAGSLVGYVRNKKMPLWMDDIDILLFEEDVRLFETEVIPYLRRAGFNAFPPKKYDGGGYHILSLQLGEQRHLPLRYAAGIDVTIPWAQVDAFYTRVDSDGHLRNLAGWGLYHVKDIPVDWVRPGRDVEIDGVEFRVFSEFERDIRKEYGDVLNNLVVASHGKTLLRVPKKRWRDVEREFNRLYFSLPNTLPPSVTAAQISAFSPVEGTVFEPSSSASFDEIVSGVISTNASDVCLCEPEHFFWALDLRRVLPQIRLHAHLRQVQGASVVTLLRHCYATIETEGVEVSRMVQEQLEALSVATLPGAANPEVRRSTADQAQIVRRPTKFIAWGQEVSWDLDIQQPPQNCLATVDFAYECGFDGVELDVQLSGDGELVLMHDATLDKTASVTGRLADFTADQLSGIALKGGFRGETQFVETFTKALQRNGHRGEIMCDLRQVNPKTLAALEKAVQSSEFDERRMLIIAYSREGGLALKARFPRSYVMLKLPEAPSLEDSGWLEQATGMDAILVNAANNLPLVESMRRATHAASLGLCVYLHHRGLSLGSLRRMVELGVDYVTTQNHRYFEQARTSSVPT